MADKKTRTTLENQFASGKIPTESNFAELIASGINQIDDGLQKAADTPLSIRTTAPADAPKDMVLLFGDFQQPDPLWRIRMRSGSLEISRGANASADFLINNNGKVGIGVPKPTAKLEVAGDIKAKSLEIEETAKLKELRMNGDVFLEPGNTVFVNYGPWATVNRKFIEFKANYLGDPNRGQVHLYAPTNYGTNVPAITLAGNYGSDGNVGIGTTEPKAKLDIDAGGGSNIGLKVNGRIQSIGAGGLWVDTDKRFVGALAADKIGFFNTAWHLVVGATGNVGIGTNAPIAKLQVVGGAIMPAEGSGEAAGILFKPDAFGGSGDRAYIRYYARSGESTTLEIGNLNDSDDHIALMPGGSVGIGTTAPAAKLHVEGAIMEKLDVIRCGGRADWGSQNHPIMLYFKGKLIGKPVGTYLKAIQDHPSWRGHYWQGWVDVDTNIRVVNNQYNTSHIVIL